jgi:hypothetical protein
MIPDRRGKPLLNPQSRQSRREVRFRVVGRLLGYHLELESSFKAERYDKSEKLPTRDRRACTSKDENSESSNEGKYLNLQASKHVRAEATDEPDANAFLSLIGVCH